MRAQARGGGVLTLGFCCLLSAQFFSGLADHAVLILAIAFLQEQGYALWWAPLMKLFFTLSYVVFAPQWGTLADAFPKSRLMAWLNALKLLGLLLMPLGVHPALSFGVIGLAAAAYAPAKYGLMMESVKARDWVRANAWLEVSVVLSVILGTVLGGVMIAVALPTATRDALFHAANSLLGLSSHLLAGFLIASAIYLLACLLNFGIPRAGPAGTGGTAEKVCAWRTFMRSNRQLWRDPLGGISLHVTTLYWGAGAVMQFLVLRWAQQNLGLGLAQAACLQATVAVGAVLGALAAGHFVRVHAARNTLPMGLLLALLLPSLVWIDALHWAVPVLLLAGALGGVLLVPMNTLMQRRGAKILSTGRSIAVQGFNENASVMLMMGLYSVALAIELPLWALLCLLSLVLILGMLPVYRPWRRRA